MSTNSNDQQRRTLKLNFRKKIDNNKSALVNEDDVSLTFNSKDLPHLNKKDLVRLSSAEDETLSIVLEANQRNDEALAKNTVCISEDVTGPVFPFKRYSEVVVECVTPADVALDLLELTFREQYISRSDMCRVRRFLLNRCVYLSGKVEFCAIRLKVRELWRKGECVPSGFVDENTRIVFRSSSALIFVFIQMSVEMWDFDTQGVCYYEKCVDGFLPELFERWRDFKCSHYVTIVLFSRWFYVNCESLQYFPLDQQCKIQKDYRGRYYQDFYQVLIQNEHYEDWKLSALGKIRSAFYKHNETIKDHMRKNCSPLAENSTASDGNVMEALNMTFNVFANHNVDRTFERTGQVIILITPGGGVFNVDRTFANMSKQRNFDYGIAVDLVCLGEQPLHAVPLLIYHSKTTSKGKPPEIEDYFIMHWVNYSYYNPLLYPNPLSSNFHPRLKVPSGMLEGQENLLLSPPNLFASSTSLSAYPDFDAYDNYVNSTMAPKRRQHKSSVPQMSPNFRPSMGRQMSEDEGLGSVGQDTYAAKANQHQPGRMIDSSSVIKNSSPPSSESYSVTPTSFDDRSVPLVDNVNNFAGSCPISIPCDVSFEADPNNASSDSDRCVAANLSASLKIDVNFNVKSTIHNLTIMGASRPLTLTGATAPARGFYSPSFTSTGELGSNDYRLRVAGTSIFYANLEEPDPTQVPEAPLLAIDVETDSAEIVAMRQKSPEKLSTLKESTVSSATSNYGASNSNKGKALIWAWGCTGEEQWNPDIEVGTDWKSMVVPSCLPITTDYFPDARSLKYDYLFSEHTILLDDSVRDMWRSSSTSTSSFSSQFSEKEDFRIKVFNELVAQRLQQGFQVVLLPLDMLNSAITVGCGPTLVPEKVSYLSISRIFHRLSLTGHCISVTKFAPRHAYPLKTFSCLYENQVPDSNCFQTTSTKFEHEDLEKINWSSIDNLITLQGETEDYLLQRDTKFWETRFFLLPSLHPATSKIFSGESVLCDIYAEYEINADYESKLLENFLKFMEILNRIRRPPNINRFPVFTKENNEKFDQSEVHLIIQTAIKGGLNFIQSNTGHLNSNVTFSNTQNQSNFLFVSAEFTHFLMGHVVGLNSTSAAVSFAQKLLNEQKIRHVNNSEQRFIYGFYLYYFNVSKFFDYNFAKNATSINNQQQTFYEIAVQSKPCRQRTTRNFCHKRFKTYKYFFDVSKRSERQEWGNIKLNQTYYLGSAFEINFQWLVATGAIVSDAVLQLHRKTTILPLCLLPAPKDPFALPENPHSDPLRTPIYIELEGNSVGLLDATQIDRLRSEIIYR
uniref:DEP domain-containing protein n=1 Tax=Romanomermis culicivorax TaxID=13658 RepID=A0A915LAE1_ROMCU